MKIRVAHGLSQVLGLILSSTLAFAQQEVPPKQELVQQDTTMLRESMPSQGRYAFTQPELDQMLAPIALYPDSLLSQILMASTYPLEVVEAARWSKANSNLKGDEAVQAVAGHMWDPSVKSLVAFPQILMMMDEKLNWMERLGDAFLGQQPQVMDTVQRLRQRASLAGNLSSNDHIRVDQEEQSIVIEQANPQVVYVPYYDPTVIYGSWWWSAYPPVYWAPWPGYFIGPRFRVGLAWGLGVVVGPGLIFGAFNWPHHHATYGRGVVWAHSPIHRRGVPYRDIALRQRFGRVSASPAIPPQFRGGQHGPFSGQRSLGSIPAPRGGSGIRPDVLSHVPGRFRAPGGQRSDFSGAPSRASQSWGGRPHAEQRMHDFERLRRGAAERNVSARGHARSQGFASRSQGDSRGDGGGGGRGSRRR